MENGAAAGGAGGYEDWGANREIGTAPAEAKQEVYTATSGAAGTDAANKTAEGRPTRG